MISKHYNGLPKEQEEVPRDQLVYTIWSHGKVMTCNEYIDHLYIKLEDYEKAEESEDEDDLWL
jgi:hypothetical protein